MRMAPFEEDPLPSSFRLTKDVNVVDGLAWVDDVAADDVAADDVAVDDSVVEGVGIVISSHHVFHEEVSHEVPYRLPIGAKTR